MTFHSKIIIPFPKLFHRLEQDFHVNDERPLENFGVVLLPRLNFEDITIITF